ncbi:MAG: hypothetical protein ACI9UT_003015 [Flavobacteriales bacterium]|jgi:hypothetical protein
MLPVGFQKAKWLSDSWDSFQSPEVGGLPLQNTGKTMSS